MTQRSRPQADNNATLAYVDSGPYSRDQWAERLYAVHTGDENTASQRLQLRGVVPTFDNMLIVTNPAGVTIRVGTGAGFCGGSFLFNNATLDFTPDTPAIATRTDKIVLVENNTNAVYDGTPSGVILDFPTDLTDYDAAPGIGPYACRLAILRGDDVTGAATALIQTANYWMIELARFNITNVPAVNTLTDYREFIDTEKIVGVHSDDDDTIEDALIIGTEVNDAVGSDGLGVGIHAKLENDNGDLEDAGQIAFRWTDSTDGSENARFELRLMASSGEGLRAVINAPPTAGAGDGNARGDGATEFQADRDNLTEVASGNYATISGGRQHTADGNYATIGGGYTHTASGEYSMVPGGDRNTADGDYSFAAGRRADTNSFDGVFIWADSENAVFTADRANQFKVRASGGTYLKQNSNAGAIAVLELDQEDDSEEMINFIVNGTGAGYPVDTATAVGAAYARLRVAVNGTFKYIQLYDA